MKPRRRAASGGRVVSSRRATVLPHRLVGLRGPHLFAVVAGPRGGGRLALVAKYLGDRRGRVDRAGRPPPAPRERERVGLGAGSPRLRSRLTAAADRVGD